MGPKVMLGRLRAARAAAAFDNCCFGNADETARIVEETRLYRETWLLPHLDAAIAALEGKVGSQRSKDQLGGGT